MDAAKEPKWELSEALRSGKNSLLLMNDYGTELQIRLKTGELEQHQANVEELELRKSGQKQNLADQVSKTQGQDELITKINKHVVGIRNLIKSSNPSQEILKGFGVGDKIQHTVGGVTAAAKIIQDAYKKFGTSSKDAGIIEADITLITTLLKSLSEAEGAQDGSMYARKAKTMDKNTLQRAVEDEVTRLWALGTHHFMNSPSIAGLFEDLIPPAHKPKTKNGGEDKTA